MPGYPSHEIITLSPLNPMKLPSDYLMLYLNLLSGLGNPIPNGNSDRTSLSSVKPIPRVPHALNSRWTIPHLGLSWGFTCVRIIEVHARFVQYVMTYTVGADVVWVGFVVGSQYLFPQQIVQLRLWGKNLSWHQPWVLWGEMWRHEVTWLSWHNCGYKTPSQTKWKYLNTKHRSGWRSRIAMIFFIIHTGFWVCSPGFHGNPSLFQHNMTETFGFWMATIFPVWRLSEQVLKTGF